MFLKVSLDMLLRTWVQHTHFNILQYNCSKINRYLEDVTHSTPYGHKLLVIQARVHLALNEPYEAIAITGRALKLRRNDLDALLLRTTIYYSLAEHETALNHVRECLRTDPDNKSCKKVYVCHPLQHSLRYQLTHNLTYSNTGTRDFEH